MKTLIIYASIHQGNTKKIADKIGEVLGAEVIEMSEASQEKIENAHMVGFGSGIYFSKFHKGLSRLVDDLPAMEDKKAFIFSTSGMKAENILNIAHDHFKKKLEKKGFRMLKNMKKAVIIFVFLFILAGCSADESKQGVDNISGNIDSDNSNQEMNKEQASEPNADNQEEDNKINLEDMDLANTYNYAVLKTNMGDIKVEFYNEAAPKTVNNFLKLAKDGFYDNTKFHRIIEDFMIQGGDPLSKDDDKKSRWGTGGPGYTFEDEINNKKLVKGSLAMANSGPDTNGSQFFIVTKEATPWLDGKHTNFGEVVEGMEVVENIDQVKTDGGDKPVKDVVVEVIEISD